MNLAIVRSERRIAELNGIARRGELRHESIPLARAGVPQALLFDGGEAVRRRLGLVSGFIDEGLAYWARFRMTSPRPRVAVYNDPDTRFVGLYYPHMQAIAVNMAMPEGMTRPITLHELGHHLDYTFTGRTANASEPVREGKADFFSACAMFGPAREEAFLHALSFFSSRWRTHMGYTLEHYEDLFSALVLGKALRRENVNDDPKSEIHELGFRLVAMYCIGRGMTLDELAVPLVTASPDRIRKELLDMIRRDRRNAIGRRIARYPELSVYNRP